MKRSKQRIRWHPLIAPAEVGTVWPGEVPTPHVKLVCLCVYGGEGGGGDTHTRMTRFRPCRHSTRTSGRELFSRASAGGDSSLRVSGFPLSYKQHIFLESLADCLATIRRNRK